MARFEAGEKIETVWQEDGEWYSGRVLQVHFKELIEESESSVSQKKQTSRQDQERSKNVKVKTEVKAEAEAETSKLKVESSGGAQEDSSEETRKQYFYTLAFSDGEVVFEVEEKFIRPFDPFHSSTATALETGGGEDSKLVGEPRNVSVENSAHQHCTNKQE